MTEPSIAEEALARQIAMWHGQTPLHRDPASGLTVTVATRTKAGRTGWAWEIDEYVDRHWREYLAAARAMIEFRSNF